MRIDRMEIYYVTFPLVYPWTTAYGSDPDGHSILVKLASGNSEGWGNPPPSTPPPTPPSRR
jgi:hypothetical protein